MVVMRTDDEVYKSAGYYDILLTGPKFRKK